jgi:hypothetical protein
MGSMLAAIGLVLFLVGGLPSTADGSTTEGGPSKTSRDDGGGSFGAATEAGESTLVGRRLTGLTEDLVEMLSRGPRGPSLDQERAASKIVELFNEFDLEAAGALYEKPSIGMEEWFLWLRGRLGQCGSGQPMSVVDATRARYIYTCEHGRLEAQFDINLDTGKIPALVMGARDVPIEDVVRAAAETVMQLYDRWDQALFERSFGEKFEAAKIQQFLLDVRAKWGDCSLGEPDLMSARGAMIHLECERGQRLLKVELGQEDDRIRTLAIRAPRQVR